VGTGNAQVTLTFDAWKPAAVKPAVVEVPVRSGDTAKK
jgi:hypothetical protein